MQLTACRNLPSVKPSPLTLPDFHRGYLDQLVGPRFADQDGGDFVVSR